MKVGVFGAGYVGLVAGVCLADSGRDVAIADVDQDKIDKLRRGEIPIYEPGLTEIFARAVREGRLSFTTDPAPAVVGRDVIFIAVGTPPAPDGAVDIRHIESAARTIAKELTDYAVIAIKSTCPPDTYRRVRQMIRAETAAEFDVVINPEFLKEGAAIDDFMRPDRVVIGAESARARRVMDELYAPFMRTRSRMIHVRPESAALGKYAANCMLAVRISFMNELARACTRLGADVDELRRIVGADPRIGAKFLFPGLGYGGSCFPKDVAALLKMAKAVGVELPVTAGAEATNAHQPLVLLPAIMETYGQDLSGRRFSVWGLAFKPRTDDVRQAPALVLIQALLERGADVTVYDPEAIKTAKRVLGGRVDYAANPLDALDDADALIVCTEWNEFRSPDFDELARRLKTKVIFDGRNVYDIDEMKRRGFTYFSVGREPVKPG